MSSEFIRQRLEGKAFSPPKEVLKSNEIPSVMVWGKTLPEAWENAVLATYEFGAHIPTEYDQPIDPESRDVSMMMTVAEPFAEPRIHKAMPDGYEGLATYVDEVVKGIHDIWVTGKEGSGWSYSYHDRLYNWPGLYSWENFLKGEKVDIPNVNQIDAFIQKLATTPHSRRAQAITWFPPIDQNISDPPCLQRIWCRLAKTESGKYLLEMNTHWRSNDALKAAFMNTFALTELQRVIAGEIGNKMGKDVGVGRYVGMMDSFHIYGSYERKNDLAMFLSQVERFPFERRVINSDDSKVLREFEISHSKLLGKEEMDK